jgi:alpha-beta hydrolase superfamily lysophospholipase
MVRYSIIAFISLFVAFSAHSEEVEYSAEDGGKIFANLDLSAKGKDGPLIILFHQAGANGRGEYANTAPLFRENGYSTLVVDLRSGGETFGGSNRTVDARGESSGYCEAMPDLIASLNYAAAQGFKGPIYAAGSSYSAALTIALGNEQADALSGVIGFSPASGGPMAACSPNEFAATTKTPTLVVRPEREMQVPSVQTQFELFKTHGHSAFIHKGGIHGASTLDETRADGDIDPVWKTVLSFLKSNAK